MSFVRGQIINRERAKQLHDFQDLRWGKITPTDIDLSVDFGGEKFAFGEIKFGTKELDFGQRLHFEFLADAISKPVAIIIAEHYVEDTEQDIDDASAIVREFYICGEWRKPLGVTTLREALDMFRIWNWII